MPWIVNRFFLTSQSRLIPRLYFIAIICATTNWLIAGAAFALYLSGFPALELSTSLFEAAGVYIFAWGVGFIALFAPQGIGVAEFTSAQLLSASYSVGTLAVLLAGFRAVILCADLLTWIFSVLVADRTAFRKPSSDSHSAQP